MWLADENIDRRAIELLRARGEDVAAVAEMEAGASDTRVLALARQENRILLSFDRDHGDLIFNRGVPPPRAIVYFRIYPPDPSTFERLLLGAVMMGAYALDGRFTVVSAQGTRQRLLPADP